MLVIGLTGGIASGKTTVSDMLAARGAAIIDTDLLAREIVQPGQPAHADIVRTWPEVQAADGTLDRAKLGALVFADPGARALLNGFTHPRIRELMLARLAAVKDVPAAVLVIPLLFENGLDVLVQETWLVAVSPAVQKQRLIAREGLTPEDADRRIASQLSLEDKLARARRVIWNDADRNALALAVDRTWQEAGL